MNLCFPSLLGVITIGIALILPYDHANRLRPRSSVKVFDDSDLINKANPSRVLQHEQGSFCLCVWSTLGKVLTQSNYHR